MTDKAKAGAALHVLNKLVEECNDQETLCNLSDRVRELSYALDEKAGKLIYK